MYRHALPPGFVLKKDKKKEEKEEEISLEELIENEVTNNRSIPQLCLTLWSQSSKRSLHIPTACSSGT